MDLVTQQPARALCQGLQFRRGQTERTLVGQHEMQALLERSAAVVQCGLGVCQVRGADLDQRVGQADADERLRVQIAQQAALLRIVRQTARCQGLQQRVRVEAGGMCQRAMTAGHYTGDAGRKVMLAAQGVGPLHQQTRQPMADYAEAHQKQSHDVSLQSPVNRLLRAADSAHALVTTLRQSPRSKPSRSNSAASMATAIWAPSVLAARCGVWMTFGRLSRG